MSRRTGNPETLRCSFCSKTQDTVAKLISNPNDDQRPRAYICDECIMVCASVLEQEESDADIGTPEPIELHPMAGHPVASQLLSAIERWIRLESVGGDAAEEFAEVRALAVRLVRSS